MSELISEPSLTEQTYYLISQACEDSKDAELCRGFLKESWNAMGPCLYKDQIVTDMICEHFGDCKYNSHTWVCDDIGHLLARVLQDPPFLWITAKQHLQECFCQEQHHCMLNVTTIDLLPDILPFLSDWVTSKTSWMCSSGKDSCSACRDVTGKKM